MIAFVGKLHRSAEALLRGLATDASKSSADIGPRRSFAARVRHQVCCDAAQRLGGYGRHREAVEVVGGVAGDIHGCEEHLLVPVHVSMIVDMSRGAPHSRVTEESST